MLIQPRTLVPFAFERRVFRTYLLLDTFGSGSLSTGGSQQNRTADIGFLRYVNTAIHAISGGRLVSNGTSSTNDLFVSGNGSAAQTLARTAGRVFGIKVVDRTTVNNAIRLGWGTGILSSGHEHSIRYAAGDTVVPNIEAGDMPSVVLGSGDHAFAFVMRSSGARIIGRDGTGTPRLLWVAQTNSADMYSKYRPGNAAMNLKLDDWMVFDYPALADDWADASVHTTPSSSGTSYSAQADGFHAVSFTLPTSPTSLMRAVELRYRVQDANNYWVAYIRRNSGNTNWDLRVDSVSGGTATSRKNTTNIGAVDRLIVEVEGSVHQHVTETSGAPTVRGGSVNVSFLDTQTSIAAVWDAATTLGSLDSWALSHALYDGLFG